MIEAKARGRLELLEFVSWKLFGILDLGFGILRISLVTAMALVVAGCGPDRPEMVPVSGTVTVGGAPPPAEGAIYFAPITVAEGLPRRPGRAEFDKSGNYQATSFEDGDGLVPGTYRVRVECWKVAPTMDKPGESYLTRDAVLPDLTVAADSGSISHDIDVPPKPSAN
jgi:hypothetical protein